ncbi:hypothetical protein ACP6JB_005959 [Aspergillus fumigatus]
MILTPSRRVEQRTRREKIEKDDRRTEQQSSVFIDRGPIKKMQNAYEYLPLAVAIIVKPQASRHAIPTSLPALNSFGDAERGNHEIGHHRGRKRKGIVIETEGQRRCLLNSR